MNLETLPLLFDDKLKEALLVIESRDGFSGLMKACADYRRSASGISKVYEYEMWQHLEPDRLGGDRLGVTNSLLRTLATDLNTARHLIVFDVDQLLEVVETGLAARRFRQVVLAIRAMLERAAITQVHMLSIRQHFDRIHKFPSAKLVTQTLTDRHFADHVKCRAAAAQTVRRYLIAQTFNWSSFDVEEGAGTIAVKKGEAIKQLTTSEGIRHLNWSVPNPEGPNIYWWYSLLCDYVHPNFGASNLFVDEQQKFELRSPNGVRNKLIKRRLARQPDHASALAHVMQIIYLPFRESLSHTAAHVNWLAAEQRHREQDLKAFERASKNGLVSRSYHRANFLY